MPTERIVVDAQGESNPTPSVGSEDLGRLSRENLDKLLDNYNRQLAFIRFMQRREKKSEPETEEGSKEIQS